MSLLKIVAIILVVAVVITWMGLLIIQATREWTIPTVADIDESWFKRDG